MDFVFLCPSNTRISPWMALSNIMFLISTTVSANAQTASRVTPCRSSAYLLKTELCFPEKQSLSSSFYFPIALKIYTFSHCFMRFELFSISYEVLQNLVSACFPNFDSCHLHSPFVYNCVILLQILCIFISLCLCTFLFIPWNAPLPPTLCLISSVIALE